MDSKDVELEPKAPLRMYPYEKYFKYSNRKFEYTDDAFPKFGKKLKNVEWKNIRDGDNTFSNFIIIWDEIHKLWEDQNEEKKRKLHNYFIEQLIKRKDTLLIGATATPFVNSDNDFNTFMKIIVGRNQLDQNLKNYIFHFNDPNVAIYPKNKSYGVEGLEADIQYYELDTVDKDEIKKEKEKFRKQNTKDPNKLIELRDKIRKISNISSTIDYRPGRRIQLDLGTIKRRPKTKNKELICKLKKISEDITEYIGDRSDKKVRKVLVLCHYNEGLLLLEQFLKKKLTNTGCNNKVFSLYGYEEKNPTTVFMKDRLKECKKLHGIKECDKPIRDKYNKYRDNSESYDNCNIVLANADYFTTGVDFYGTTRLILVNTPESYSEFLQKMGRVTRACRFDENYVFDVQIYVARTNNPDYETEDVINLSKIVEQKKKYHAQNEKMHNLSFQIMVQDLRIKKQIERQIKNEKLPNKTQKPKRSFLRRITSYFFK